LPAGNGSGLGAYFSHSVDGDIAPVLPVILDVL
jgi:hypothetical protein